MVNVIVEEEKHCWCWNLFQRRDSPAISRILAHIFLPLLHVAPKSPSTSRVSPPSDFQGADFNKAFPTACMRRTGECSHPHVGAVKCWAFVPGTGEKMGFWSLCFWQRKKKIMVENNTALPGSMKSKASPAEAKHLLVPALGSLQFPLPRAVISPNGVPPVWVPQALLCSMLLLRSFLPPGGTIPTEIPALRNVH